MKRSLRISILVDNPKSWFLKYIGDVFSAVKRYDPEFRFVDGAGRLKKGDILFALSCDRVLKESDLKLHRNNIVIHEADIPKGRGWSPLTWQVESGKKRIPVTLFEASEGCDTGDWYIKDHIMLDGTELIDEIRKKQAKKTVELIKRFLGGYPMKARPQKGRATHYRRRAPKDNELDVNKTIKEQFDKMRVADNERYPLHFKYKGKKYKLKIYKDNDK